MYTVKAELCHRCKVCPEKGNFIWIGFCFTIKNRGFIVDEGEFIPIIGRLILNKGGLILNKGRVVGKETIIHVSPCSRG